MRPRRTDLGARILNLAFGFDRSDHRLELGVLVVIAEHRDDEGDEVFDAMFVVPFSIEATVDVYG